MRVLIVAKTRRGSGACVGGLTHEGRSVRLVAADAEFNPHAGLEYAVGEVWEMDLDPDPNLVPPHVENVIVRRARRLGRRRDLEALVERLMPPVKGGPEALFDGLLQALPSGSLYIAEETGLPSRSTMFWRPDRPLFRDTHGKRIHYRYPEPGPDDPGGRLLAYVGFQEPVERLPAGTLLRVSLAHWWRPPDRPDDPLRCHAQLSGWIPSPAVPAATEAASASPPSASPERARARETIPPDPDRLRRVLKDTFGFTDFLPVQEAVIRRVLDGDDTLVVMPTGGGKSLCYQLPALLFDGLTVVVSPLIALMQDQVSQLRELGAPAAFLNSTLSNREYVEVTDRVRSGEIRLLYVAPETLLRPETRVLLAESRVRCLAVDEAHCISEWGHDFRPEYRQLQEVRQRFPAAVCVALTATATPRVRTDVRRLLSVPPEGEFIASFNRPNLFLAVEPRRGGLGQVLAFLEAHRGQAGIIYCATRKQVDRLAAELTARQWPALAYHAGLDDSERRRNQARFVRADDAVMVATVAFGMGIDKSDVRYVLHYNLPKDIESYYQEIGRSGRDGLPADCRLLHSRQDAITIRRFIDEGAAAEAAGRQARLEAMIRYAETTACRRVPLLGYFGETPDGPCGHCDNCRSDAEPAEQTDVTEAARKFFTCVQRTGEVFGVGHIVNVLRGSQAKRVVARGHDQLAEHGSGRELSTEAWRDLARQFLDQGLLQQDMEHGGVSLTPKGRQVLRQETPVLARWKPVAEKAPKRAAAATALPEHDHELFERLRVLRRELADAAGVAAYVIFSDRSLVEMAARYPRTDEEFLSISGVGRVKLTHYGPAFLKLIRDYCEARGIERPPPPEPAASASPSRQTEWLTRAERPRRHQRVGERFEAGESLEDLVASFGLKRSTVLSYLARWVHEGGRPDPARLLAESCLPEDERRRVFAAFEACGTERLSPVYEALQGRVDYDELHLFQLYLQVR